MASFKQPKANANASANLAFLRWTAVGMLAMMLSALVFMMAVAPANASSKKEPAAEEEVANTEPVIPDTVIIPDPVSLTVVLPKSGTCLLYTSPSPRDS